MPPKTIGERILSLRTKQRLSICQLSDASGVGKATISDLERFNPDARPSALVLYKLSAAFGCRMEYLLGEPDLEGDGNGEQPTHLQTIADLRKRLKKIERIAGGTDAP